MNYKDFREWATKHTMDGCWRFNMARLCVYTITVMDAVPRRKRERVWRQFQNIINVNHLVEMHENPPKVTQYDRLRNLSIEGLATVIDHFENIAEKMCDPRFCKKWRADGMCGGCGSDACHQATVNWLNSEVEVYTPSATNAVSIHSVKEGKSDVGGEKMDGKGEVRFPDPPKEEML